MDDVGSQSVLLQASIVMGDDWQNVEVFFFVMTFTTILMRIPQMII